LGFAFHTVLLYYLYDLSERPHHALYENAPIDNAHTSWLGFESVWALTALLAGSFACSMAQ
jgi:hypothetical protein